MPNDFKSVDIWVGMFTSDAALSEYVEERPAHYQDETDSVQISQLAEDMGAWFIDHDFLCAVFIAELSLDITHLLAESLVSDRFGDPKTGRFGESFLAARYLEQRRDAVNSCVLIYGDKIETPKSVSGAEYWLQYVGRFYEQS
jgi:Immunity protein 22